MAATITSSSSTTLHCRHCGGEVGSNSRRVQCLHCGAMFPFACFVCSRNLRSPFPVFDDERYLTFETNDPATGAVIEAKPLCPDHFLRHCPDCERWFHAHENPGYFRCASCAKKQEELEKGQAAAPEPALHDDRPLLHPDGAGVGHARPLNVNMVVLAAGGGAFIGLICWLVMTHGK